jgi:ketosteroid isomerase-like protein
MIDLAWAKAFAEEWIAAWNSHDLERIFSHYTDDFEMSSPLIVERNFSPTGKLVGKEAIRPYWGGGITSAQPPLCFELIDVFAGVDSMTIYYRSVGRRFVLEVLYFDENKRVVRSMAQYGKSVSSSQ